MESPTQQDTKSLVNREAIDEMIMSFDKMTHEINALRGNIGESMMPKMIRYVPEPEEKHILRHRKAVERRKKKKRGGHK